MVSMRKVLIVIIEISLLILSIECSEEVSVETEAVTTQVWTCSDSSCSVNNNEIIETTSARITTSKATTQVRKKIENDENTNQHHDDTKSDAGQKKNPVVLPGKVKPKQTLKPKEDNIKGNTDKTTHEQGNETANDTKSRDQIKTKTKHILVKSCSCDTTRGECEINCCCDEDCSKESKMAFSHCQDESNYISKSDYCFTPNVVYKNNTPYKAFNLRPGLLCIARDNLPDKIKFFTHKVIDTEEKMLKVLNKRKAYSWGLMQSKLTTEFDRETVYSAGQPIWTLRNSSYHISLHKLTMPKEGVSSLCQINYEIGYLENSESSCLMKMPTSSKECESLQSLSVASYLNLHVLKSPLLINATPDLEYEDLDKKFVKINLNICNDKKCHNVTDSDMTKTDEKNKKCVNLVKNVNYFVKHNGTEGIDQVHCYLDLINVTMKGGWLRQGFRVRYAWPKKSNSTFPRSGKPGYLSVKPLITGRKAENKDNTDVFVASQDPKNWMSTVEAGHDGYCSHMRSNIVFGQNILSECTIKIQRHQINEADNCSSLYQKVLSHLYGELENSDNFWISSWGDPRPNDSSAWVPVVSTGDVPIASCRHLITSIHYRFIYSFTGPVGSPRIKLVGASVEALTTPFQCESSECSLKLTTTVAFTTVTSVPRLLYPKNPALRIHLPRDFFYPFSSSSWTNSLFYNPITASFLSFCIIFIFTL